MIAEYLDNALRHKVYAEAEIEETLVQLTLYFKEALRVNHLDNEVQRGNERSTGVLEVEKGMVTFVKKSKYGHNRETLYNGNNWIHYAGYGTPDAFMKQLLDNFKPAYKE